MQPTVGFLRNVTVLAGLPDELLERLAGEVVELRIPAGEWIMHDGDVADSLFIVRSGRLEVVDEGPPETLIRVLRRGDVLGELALLGEDIRSASVRARRDSALLKLGRDAFEALIQEAPSFALGFARAMGRELAASRTPITAAVPPRRIAVIGLDSAAPAADVAEGLSEALARHGSVASLSAGEVSAIDQAERDADRVLLHGSSTPDEAWTGLCVREADVIVAVTTGTPDRAWMERAAALKGCELLVFGPAAATVTLDELDPHETQVVSDMARQRDTLEATARRLAGRSLGIVFSGGGARGLAHLGVLEELRAAGLRFDRVGGVSFGSFVAATTAAGFTTELMFETFERGFIRDNPSKDYAIPAYSLLRGAKARRLLAEAFGRRLIEELPLRFFCQSVDLIARETVVHRTGPVADALYPSAAIPGVLPPVATRHGQLLVDGGVLDNLPVATMARTGEGPVIAVDVTGRQGPFARPGRPRLDRMGRPIRRTLTGSEARIPRLGETILRTLTVGSVDTVAAAHPYADLVISPQVDGIGLLDWKAFEHVVELGRQAAREALAADPDLPSRLSA